MVGAIHPRRDNWYDLFMFFINTDARGLKWKMSTNYVMACCVEFMSIKAALHCDIL